MIFHCRLLIKLQCLIRILQHANATFIKHTQQIQCLLIILSSLTLTVIQNTAGYTIKNIFCLHKGLCIFHILLIASTLFSFILFLRLRKLSIERSKISTQLIEQRVQLKPLAVRQHQICHSLFQFGKITNLPL